MLQILEKKSKNLICNPLRPTTQGGRWLNLSNELELIQLLARIETFCVSNTRTVDAMNSGNVMTFEVIEYSSTSLCMQMIFPAICITQETTYLWLENCIFILVTLYNIFFRAISID